MPLPDDFWEAPPKDEEARPFHEPGFLANWSNPNPCMEILIPISMGVGPTTPLTFKSTPYSQKSDNSKSSPHH